MVEICPFHDEGTSDGKIKKAKDKNLRVTLIEIRVRDSRRMKDD